MLRRFLDRYARRTEAPSAPASRLAVEEPLVAFERPSAPMAPASIPAEAYQFTSPGTLADDLLHGLRELLPRGAFIINEGRAHVYVGQAATALVVPLVLRRVIAHLKQSEPENPRLEILPDRDEGLAFVVLNDAGYLLTRADRNVWPARIARPGRARLAHRPVGLLLIENERLWTGLKRPETFDGVIYHGLGRPGETLPGFAPKRQQP